MKFIKWSLVVFIIVALSAVLGLGVIAADEEPTPGTPEDNACYEGGVMADKCTTDWHWVCGYYMARFYTRSYYAGDYDTSLVPDWCASLLPQRPEPPAVSSLPAFPSGGCELTFTIPSNTYVDFAGGYIGNGLTTYDDASCTNATGSIGNYVYAPAGYDPDMLCESAYGAGRNAIANDPGTDVWFCG